MIGEIICVVALLGVLVWYVRYDNRERGNNRERVKCPVKPKVDSLQAGRKGSGSKHAGSIPGGAP